MRRKHEEERLATDSVTDDVADDGEAELPNENDDRVGFVAALKQVSDSVPLSVFVL